MPPIATARFIQVAGWEETCLSEPLAQTAIMRTAQTVLKEIIAYIPVRDGEYQDSFKAQAHVYPWMGTGTAAAKITGLEPRWHIIEFGTAYAGVHNPPYAPIRRGVTSTGLRWLGS